MANTVLLPVGYPYAVVKDQIYALPARRLLMFAEGTPTYFQSQTVAFTASKAVTLDANNQAELAGGFLRVTSNSPGNITLKAL